ncbi:MAG TPA: hypothetical protein VGF29_12735 [Hyphomicrobiaceae bacterium]
MNGVAEAEVQRAPRQPPAIHNTARHVRRAEVVEAIEPVTRLRLDGAVAFDMRGV